MAKRWLLDSLLLNILELWLLEGGLLLGGSLMEVQLYTNDHQVICDVIAGAWG